MSREQNETMEWVTDAMDEQIATLRRERDEAITARNAAWREAADLRVALDKVRAQRDAAQSGGPSDERKPCGCTMGARWITVKHCGGHAFPADERLGGGR